MQIVEIYKSSVMAAMLKCERWGTVKVANVLELPVNFESAAESALVRYGMPNQPAADFNRTVRQDLDKDAVLASEPENHAVSTGMRNTGGNELKNESVDKNIAIGTLEEGVRMHGESLEGSFGCGPVRSRSDEIRSIGAGRSDCTDSENFETFLEVGELCGESVESALGIDGGVGLLLIDGESDARVLNAESPNRNHPFNPNVKARVLKVTGRVIIADVVSAITAKNQPALFWTYGLIKNLTFALNFLQLSGMHEMHTKLTE